jgi:hypothetical protein
MNPTDIDRSLEIVEDALRSAPLAPVPGTLRSGVMRRVQSLSAAPKFAFPWLEAAISLMLSTLLTGVATLVLELPPAALLRLQQAFRFFFLLPANRPLIAGTMIGAAMLVLCLLLSAWIFFRRSGRGPRIVPAR